MAVNCAAFSSPLRARALPCLPHCGALGHLPTQLRGRAPAFVGGWRQARRHGGRSVLRNCSTGGRRCCSDRSALFRPSELFDGRSALLFRSVSAVPSFGTFPQLDKSFPQIPEKLLTNVCGGAILISHPNRKVYPPNVRPRAPANAVAASLFVGTAENPSSFNAWRAFSLPAAALSLLRKRRASRHKAACDGLRVGALPAVSAPWGARQAGRGGWTTGGRTTERGAREPYLIKGTE